MNGEPNAWDGYVSLAEAATLVPSPRLGKQTNVCTLHRWVNSGKLAAVRRGRWYFVRVSDLEAMMQPANPQPRPPVISTRQQTINQKRAGDVLVAAGIRT